MAKVIKMSAIDVGFHGFTFGGSAFAGNVHTFEDVEGVISFTYGYTEDGSKLAGSFTGEVKDGTVQGAWKEIANPPLNGASTFNGGATLVVIESNGRRILHGEWTWKNAPSGRWLLEIAS